MEMETKALDARADDTAQPFAGGRFLVPGSGISGKSVVLGDSASKTAEPDMWPYSLHDYLKSYLGKTVCVSYVLPNGRLYEKRGQLKATGVDFIAIRPLQTNTLCFFMLSAVKSVGILGV